MKDILLLIAISGLLSNLGTPVIADGDPVAKPFDSVEKEFNEGRAAIYGGIFEQAIALIKRVVEVELNNAGAYNYLGFAYCKTGRSWQASYNSIPVPNNLDFDETDC